MDKQPQDRSTGRRTTTGVRSGGPGPEEIMEQRPEVDQAEAQARRQAEVEQKRALGHEPSDVAIRPLTLIGAGVFIFVVLIGVGLWGLFTFYASLAAGADRPQTALTEQRPPPPEPRLQVNPPADWQALRATEETTLNSYGWVDRGAGTVRIPIDRAIDLLVQRGLPTSAPTAQPATTPQPTATPSQ